MSIGRKQMKRPLVVALITLAILAASIGSVHAGKTLRTGIKGAAAGALVGAVIGGSDGAAKGAMIGGGVGLLKGASDNNKRKKRNKKHRKRAQQHRRNR